MYICSSVPVELPEEELEGKIRRLATLNGINIHGIRRTFEAWKESYAVFRGATWNGSPRMRVKVSGYGKKRRVRVWVTPIGIGVNAFTLWTLRIGLIPIAVTLLVDWRYALYSAVPLLFFLSETIVLSWYYSFGDWEGSQLYQGMTDFCRELWDELHPSEISN